MDINLTGQIASQVATNLAQPSYVPFLNVIGGALSAGVGALAVYYTNKRATEREKNREWFESRKLAYYKFIKIFSRPFDENIGIIEYLDAALEAYGYGNIFIPSFNFEESPIANDNNIESLDKLLATLLFMNTSHQFRNFEKLRAQAFTPFLNALMNKLIEEAPG